MLENKTTTQGSLIGLYSFERKLRGRTEQRKHGVRLGHVHDAHVRSIDQRLSGHGNALAALPRARARLRIGRQLRRRCGVCHLRRLRLSTKHM